MLKTPGQLLKKLFRKLNKYTKKGETENHIKLKQQKAEKVEDINRNKGNKQNSNKYGRC